MTELREYPPKPEHTEEYLNDHYGYEKPTELGEWQWSITFGRWSRLVTFANGWRGYTYPKHEIQVENDPEYNFQLEEQTMLLREWYLVTYPNGVKLIEEFTPGELDVKKRAIGENGQLSKVIVLAEEKEQTMSITTEQSLKESTQRREELHQRYAAAYRKMGLVKHSFTTTQGDSKTLTIVLPHANEEYKRKELRLPIPTSIGIGPLWIKPDVSITDLADCARIKTYDTALPYQWVKAHYLDRGLDFPTGVWSYDTHRFGEFISLQSMMEIIADLLIHDGLVALGLQTTPEESTQP